MKDSTKCIHSGNYVDKTEGGVVTPVFTSTSYEYLDRDIQAYPRSLNTPNQIAVSKKIAALENAEDAAVFSSGMAAISTSILAVSGGSGHVLLQKGLYGGTTSFAVKYLDDFGIEYTFTNGRNVEDFSSLIKENTKLIYIETPSNPLLNITDIKKIANLAKLKNIITIIDNTFATPINQKPIEMGIDISVHSATKYFGGHSDLCAGAVASTKEYTEQIRNLGRRLGGSLDSQACCLMERSLKTLSIRMERHNSNALEVARFLETHPKIDQVFYPGLDSNPGYDIARKQMKGFGGMLTFRLKDNVNPYAYQKRLKLIFPSMSLGGVESTICSPALTSHNSLTDEQRAKEGIDNYLLRLSVGIEDIEDLKYDLDQAF